MFKTNSEKVFLTLMTIMAIALFFTISGCALLDKLRGVANPHAEIVIETPTTVEDVRG